MAPTPCASSHNRRREWGRHRHFHAPHAPHCRCGCRRTRAGAAAQLALPLRPPAVRGQAVPCLPRRRRPPRDALVRLPHGPGRNARWSQLCPRPLSRFRVARQECGVAPRPRAGARVSGSAHAASLPRRTSTDGALRTRKSLPWTRAGLPPRASAPRFRLVLPLHARSRRPSAAPPL